MSMVIEDGADLYAAPLAGAFAKACGGNQGNDHAESCALVAPLAGGGVALRDSKDPDRPELRFTEEEFAALKGWEPMQAVTA